MNYHDRITIQRKFFASGCKEINFNGCEQLFQKYQKAVNAPGCSSCAKRRAQSEYSKQIHNKIIELDFAQVNKPKN